MGQNLTAKEKLRRNLLRQRSGLPLEETSGLQSTLVVTESRDDEEEMIVEPTLELPTLPTSAPVKKKKRKSNDAKNEEKRQKRKFFKGSKVDEPEDEEDRRRKALRQEAIRKEEEEERKKNEQEAIKKEEDEKKKALRQEAFKKEEERKRKEQEEAKLKREARKKEAEKKKEVKEVTSESKASTAAFFVTVNRPEAIEAARAELPIVAEEQRVMEVLQANTVMVLCGETGSGKTTQMPQFLYEAGYGHPQSPHPGKIGITEPRRVAAMSMAQRLQTELPLEPGRIGYQVSFNVVSLVDSLRCHSD